MEASTVFFTTGHSLCSLLEEFFLLEKCLRYYEGQYKRGLCEQFDWTSIQGYLAPRENLVWKHPGNIQSLFLGEEKRPSNSNTGFSIHIEI